MRLTHLNVGDHIKNHPFMAIPTHARTRAAARNRIAERLRDGATSSRTAARDVTVGAAYGRFGKRQICRRKALRYQYFGRRRLIWQRAGLCLLSFAPPIGARALGARLGLFGLMQGDDRRCNRLVSQWNRFIPCCAWDLAHDVHDRTSTLLEIARGRCKGNRAFARSNQKRAMRLGISFKPRPRKGSWRGIGSQLAARIAYDETASHSSAKQQC